LPHRILAPIDRCVSPRDLGYPLQAFITAVVDQHRLDEVIKQLQTIAQVTQVTGISGVADLLIAVVATDADDLYRVAGLVLAVPGVERTHDVGGDARGRCLPHPAVVGAARTAAVSTIAETGGARGHFGARAVFGRPGDGPLCEQWPGHGPPSTAPG
jgi:Lrp/AsnC ligand binding domain